MQGLSESLHFTLLNCVYYTSLCGYSTNTVAAPSNDAKPEMFCSTTAPPAGYQKNTFSCLLPFCSVIKFRVAFLETTIQII